MPRRPASSRLLKESYIFRPRVLTDDGKGGSTETYPTVDNVTLKGTQVAIDTEDFADVVGNQVADRGQYIVFLDPKTNTLKFEDRLINRDVTYRVIRTSRQLGLTRTVLSEVLS